MMRKLLLLPVFALLCSFSVYSQAPGLIYGITNVSYTGGGTLFYYDPLTGKNKLLLNFNPSAGSQPYGSLVQALNGNLYALTSVNPSLGTLFYYNPATGKDSASVSFTGPNGSTPYGSLIQAHDSLLYGLTSQGGASGTGVLFSFNTYTGKDSTRFSFSGAMGASPTGTLLQVSDSLFYGMTYGGGTNNYGVLFKFDPRTNIETVLVNFNNTNGAHPIFGSLVQDTNGLLYGLANAGGTWNGGVLFSYNIATGKDSVCYNFSSVSGDNPYGSLIHDSKGLLYGMTSAGGPLGNGDIFLFNPVSGKDSILFNFSAASGNAPEGDLLLGSGGILYGMTKNGGTYNLGTLFSFNLNTGKDSVLINFNDTVGANPYGSPVQIMSMSMQGNDSLKCFGDSTGWAKIAARGATPPLSYNWSNGATSDSIGNLKAGAYRCTVKDSRGITLTDTVHIYQPGQITPAPSVSNLCFGDSDGVARAFVNGGTKPFKYLWGNGATTDSITGLKTGSYTCTVTDANGCATILICTITQAPPLKIDSVVYTPATWPAYNNGVAKVYVSGGIPNGDSAYQYFNYYYSWSPGSDSTTASDSLVIHGLSPGVTYINVSNACGLVQDSIMLPMGLNSVAEGGKYVKIYPVPSSGMVTVAIHGTGFQRLTIYDELGRNMYQSALNDEQVAQEQFIDLSSRPNGIYIVQLVNKNGTETHKIIIDK